MPAKLQSSLSIPSDIPPGYDEVLITEVIAAINYAAPGDITKDERGNDMVRPSGNIEVGDMLPVDVNGVYHSEEKYSVHFLLLNAGEVVYKGNVIIDGPALQNAETRNPGARDAIKYSAYEVLENQGIVPAGATIQ